MLDPKLLRTSLDLVKTALKQRGFEADFKFWQELEDSRKRLQADTEKMKASLNEVSKEIGQLKAVKKDSSKNEKKASKLTTEIKQKSSKLESILLELNEFSLGLPNIPDPDVPEGNSEEDNQEIRTWGKIPEFSFEAKDHMEIGRLTGGIDMEAGSRVTGSRFSVLKSDLASLHRALIKFMLETHIFEHGYQEVYVPYIVNKDSLVGTGQLPKFLDQIHCLFPIKNITQEDANRTELYKKMKRSAVSSSKKETDIKDFLKSLSMEMNIYEKNSKNNDRAVQLINKTNQFNLNGIRRSKMNYD